MRDSERERVRAGHKPLTCHEIYELVLRQARERINEDIKLRAVGYSPFQTAQGAGNRKAYRERTQDEQDRQVGGGRRDEREYNICHVVGHIARNCPTPASG